MPRADPLRNTLDHLALDPAAKEDRRYLVSMLRRLGYSERQIEEALGPESGRVIEVEYRPGRPGAGEGAFTVVQDEGWSEDNIDWAATEAPPEPVAETAWPEQEAWPEPSHQDLEQPGEPWPEQEAWPEPSHQDLEQPGEPWAESQEAWPEPQDDLVEFTESRQELVEFEERRPSDEELRAHEDRPEEPGETGPVAFSVARRSATGDPHMDWISADGPSPSGNTGWTSPDDLEPDGPGQQDGSEWATQEAWPEPEETQWGDGSDAGWSDEAGEAWSGDAAGDTTEAAWHAPDEAPPGQAMEMPAPDDAQWEDPTRDGPHEAPEAWDDLPETSPGDAQEHAPEAWDQGTQSWDAPEEAAWADAGPEPSKEYAVTEAPAGSWAPVEAEPEPFTYGDYTLHTRLVELGADREQRIYFFAKGQPRSGEPCPLPPGYVVEENDRTGLPFLRRDSAQASNRCLATTQAGTQCRNTSRGSSKYCTVHHGWRDAKAPGKAS